MALITDCISILENKDGFPENWIKDFSFKSETISNSSISKIYGRANSISYSIYEKFNLSILNGEYLSIEETSKQLDQLLKIIDLIPSYVELDTELIETQNQIADILLFGFVQPLKTSIRAYKSFLHRLNRSLKYNEHSILFEVLSTSQSDNFNENRYLDTLKLSNTFHLNVKLASIDHNLSVKKEILNELILIKSELVKSVHNSNNKFESVILDKCNFLIKKVLYRFQEDSQNYLYAFDFEDKELEIDDLVINYFNNFDLVTKAHYEKITNHGSQRKKWLEKVYEKTRTKTPLNYKDFHVSVKEYKDGTRNLSQLENLYRNFRTIYDNQLSQQTTSLFDQRALHITCNYMFNNYFSFLLSEDGVEFDKIESKYKEIRTLQSETKIRNYFPCIKYTEYLGKKIDWLFKQAEVETIKVNSFITKFELALKESYENYEWCLDKNFLAFQLPSDECKINCTLEDIKLNLFLSSSFVLPINYEIVMRDLKEFSRKLEKYKTLLEVHENLIHEKLIIKDIRESIERNDRRSVEILGIFSAVVLFTSSSVQIFSIKDVHFKDALKFMLCFSYSLTLFVFLVWLITRENIKSVTMIHKIFFFALALVALISMLFTLNWYPFNN